MSTFSGDVVDQSGEPMANVQVHLERELLDGTRVPITSTTTDPKGSYLITYQPIGAPATLAVVLKNTPGTPTKIVVSPSDMERVDFRLGAESPTSPLPAFNELYRRLEPVLDGDSVPLAELDQAGVARLAIAAGVHPKDVAMARESVVSAALASTLPGSPNLPKELFFALGKAGLSSALADLRKHSPQERADALNRAIASGVLTEADAQAAQAALADLDALAIDSALAIGTTVSTPGHALQLANVPQQSREAVLQAWAAHQGTPDQFWDGLSSNLMTAQQKEKAKFALQLQTLTRANAPMVGALFSGFVNAEALAATEPSYWANLAAQHGVPQHLSDAGMTAAEYGTAMFDAVEAAFPTKMLAARKTWFTSGTALESFLTGNASYDLAGRPLRELLRANPQAIQAAGTAQQQAAVLAELPILERLYRIAPAGAKFEVGAALPGRRIRGQFRSLDPAQGAARRR